MGTRSAVRRKSQKVQASAVRLKSQKVQSKICSWGRSSKCFCTQRSSELLCRFYGRERQYRLCSKSVAWPVKPQFSCSACENSQCFERRPDDDNTDSIEIVDSCIVIKQDHWTRRTRFLQVRCSDGRCKSVRGTRLYPQPVPPCGLEAADRMLATRVEFDFDGPLPAHWGTSYDPQQRVVLFRARWGKVFHKHVPPYG